MHGMTRKGQTTAEYAILLTVVVGAIVAMQIYVKRGIQGKVKGTMDYLSQTQTAETGTITQYEPYTGSSDYGVDQSRSATESMAKGGSVTKSAIIETTTRTGSSKTETDMSKDDSWK